MSRTLIIQSYRDHSVPGWISRCLDSVRDWAAAAGHDYELFGDGCFELCGRDYLDRVGGNLRSITNLARLELIKRAHLAGYEMAVWVDADIFVFDPVGFNIDGVARYAFARETWLEAYPPRWRAFSAVNNSVLACRRGEPDLEFLITATRHVALHRQISDNYQVGGDLIKGLRVPLAFETLDHVGMFSNFMVRALARNVSPLLLLQGRLHGAPVYAANLCASANYAQVGESDAQAAIDLLERTRGSVINDGLDAAGCLPPGHELWIDDPALATLDV